jgi:hypothetical protein
MGEMNRVTDYDPGFEPATVSATSLAHVLENVGYQSLPHNIITNNRKPHPVQKYTFNT